MNPDYSFTSGLTMSTRSKDQIASLMMKEKNSDAQYAR